MYPTFKRFLVISVLSLMSAGAIAQEDSAQSEWSLPAGEELVPNTIKLAEGNLGKGDSIISSEYKFVTTGLLKDDVELDKDGIVIPKGTKAFALRNYTYFGDGWTTINIAMKKPTLWCFVLEPGSVNGQEEGKQFCAQKRDGKPATYHTNASPFLYGSWLRVKSALHFGGRTQGGAPEIDVQPVDFGNELRQELYISKISKKSVKLGLLKTDGKSSLGSFRWEIQKHKWDKNGLIILDTQFGKLELAKVDAKTMTAKLIAE